MANDELKFRQRMPAEWERQDAVWLSWPPVRSHIWEDDRPAVEAAFADLIALLSRLQPVCVNVHPGEEGKVGQLLQIAGAAKDAVHLFSHPLNDVWCRDHGPVFVRRTDGSLAVTDWRFNAWGGKYPPWDDDNRIPQRIAAALGLPCESYSLILEGGGIEVNGAGILMTTEAVMLNPNRNAGVSRQQQEAIIGPALGVEEFIWLGDGVYGDDTDGHIDNIARFFDSHSVLALVEPDSADPSHAPLAENLRRLEEWRDRTGRGLNVVQLPAPEPVWVRQGSSQRRLPASYANFLIVNGAVIVPIFGNAAADGRALGIIGECFPGREILSFDSRQFLLEGGAVHCLTQQQPTKSASCDD